MYDLVIRGGSIVDGSGTPAETNDIAISDGIICEVGRIASRGHREIDADGLLVTPGWIDLHTHYDGQVTWDEQLAPSFWHGVTTLIMGNCGVGFAPCEPDRREWLIELMEGVEDIPGTALSEGIRWNWESFPEYLDALATSSRTMDVGALMPHGPLRAYVMGERGAANEVATKGDIARMKALVSEAMDAGAFGVSTSRTLGHRALDGRPVPGTFADRDELHAIAKAIAASGHGELQAAPAGLAQGDWAEAMDELDLLINLSAETGCPISYLFAQQMDNPDEWRDRMQRTFAGAKLGARVTPQVFARGVGLLSSLNGHFHPFMEAPGWLELRNTPPSERIKRLQNDPALRGRLISEGSATARAPRSAPGLGPNWFLDWDNIYRFGTNGDFEPSPDESIGSIARISGRDPWELALEALLEDDGQSFLWLPVLGYADKNLSPLGEMIADERTLMGGGDGGAHCSYICDAAWPTYMLTHWVRDRKRGSRLPLEFVIKKQTADAARSLGLKDRGLIQTGLRADINIIDFSELKCTPVRMVADLPGGASRLLQQSEGYIATIVSGIVTREGRNDTGARPGKLLRSRRHV